MMQRRSNLRLIFAASRRARRGFTFIEVLFATILLGIGFIMIAGIFPVAIEQSQQVADETAGQAVLRDAVRQIQQAADSAVSSSSNSFFQPTPTSGANPQILPLAIGVSSGNATAQSSNLASAIGMNGFFTEDHRYGWVGFYRRDAVTSPYAQVYIVALENPNFLNYVYPPPVPAPTGGTSSFNPPTTYVAPSQVTLKFNYSNDGNSTVDFGALNSNACSGAFALVVRSDDYPKLIGRFFRLGVDQSTTTDSFFVLQPGDDPSYSDFGLSNANPGSTATSANVYVYVIGRGPTASSTGFSGTIPGFSGPNQDVAAGSAFIRVNTFAN